MVDVVYTPGDDAISLTVIGHAGSAEHGHDLVCASASILAYTLAAAIMAKYEDRKLTSEPLISLIPGNASIICSPMPLERSGVIGAFELILIGFTLLSGKYPEYVRLTNNGVSPEA